MKALILAAGFGTRARPLTASLPKPMMPVVNRPVMAFLVDHLRRFGFNQIMVNTGHNAPQIERHFGDGGLFGVDMAYSFEGRSRAGRLQARPRGTAGAIRHIHEHAGFFNETFVVLSGDALADLDLQELLRFHRERGALATVVLREVPHRRPCRPGAPALDDDGRITGFRERAGLDAAERQWDSAGIYMFEPDVLDWIPRDRPFDILDQLIPALVGAGANVHGMLAARPWQWLEIRDMSDLHALNMKALKQEIVGFRMPGRELQPGVWAGLNVRADLARCHITPPVYLGGSAELEPGCSLVGPVVLGAGAVVERGATLQETVVLEHTRIGAGAWFKGKIVGSRFCAGTDGTVLDNRHTDISWLFADARSSHDATTPERTAVRAAALGQARAPAYVI